MALSSSLVTLTDYWYNLFTANKVALGLQDIYWGDQAKIPRTPSLCIEPVRRTNNIAAAAARRRFDPEVEVSMIVYHAPVKSTQINQREVILFSEAVEDLVHTKANMDGLVVHCYVASIEAGYAEKGDTVMRASRLSVIHLTQKILSS